MWKDKIVSPENVLEKIERDYRDIDILPEIKNQLEPLYIAWKKLLEVYPDMEGKL